MTDDGRDFLEMVQERLDSLKRDDALLAAQEEGVRRKRAELGQAMEKLKVAAEAYRYLMVRQTEPAPGQLAVVSQPSQTLADLIAEHMAEHDGRAKVITLVHRLVEVGRLPSRSDKYGSNYGTVYTALLRDERFEKVGRGEWTLRKDDNEPTAATG
jgi:hypothetical protein